MANKLKKHLNEYARIPNSILNNTKLSLKAKGLYALIESKPENWNFSARGLASQTKESIDSISSGLKELEECKLLERIRYQDKSGYWQVEYHLYESNPTMENPVQENPDQENPDTGKTPNIVRKTKKERLSKKDLSMASKESSVSIKYYQVVKKYQLPVRNHSNLRNKIKELEKIDGSEKYLDFLLQFNYQDLQLDFKPELNESLDIYTKRIQIMNQIRRSQNDKPKYVEV